MRDFKLVINNLSKAIKSTNLLETHESAQFVQWDENTLNTPYKAGLTTSGAGFAICMGNYNTYQSVLCFALHDNRLWAWSKHVNKWTEFAQK